MKIRSARTWKRSTFEFLSIFIAVISAFALNNWNDNRKDRNAENKILIEIYNGLEKDLDDIHQNQFGHQVGLNAVNYFKDLLADKPVHSDSIKIQYFRLTRDFISIQNTSGYETLKSRGFELIENDSLRSNIISLYEYDYNSLRKLEEEYFESQFQENYFKEINDAIAPSIEFNEDMDMVGINTPLEIDPKKEKVLLVYFWKIESNRKFILQFYSVVEKRIEQLRAEIKEEIEG